ncbi:MAG: VWA domain-containing protein [Pseudomonadales bacterium]
MWGRVCDPQLLDNMIAARKTRHGTRLLAWTLSIIITLAILAAAGPSWRKQSYPILESTSARVVALDLSRSMLVEDIKPKRLVNAVTAAREIISTDYEGETGLVVFAGRAFVVSPLSRDAKTLLAFLDVLDPSTMPEDGTRIDLAIGTAQGLLEASFARKGQILVITAGASIDGTRAVQAALKAANQGHRLSILAIGTAAGAPLLDLEGRLVRDKTGKSVMTRTNFQLLERIAQVGNGSLVKLKETRGNGNHLFSRLGADELIESEETADSSQRAAANDGAWIVWLALPFTLVLFRKNLIWMLLLTVMVPDGRELYAKEWDSFWNHPEKLAFEAYLRGDYQSSYELSTNPLLQGSAYYRNGNYQQALERFSEDDSAASIFNLGNSLAQQNRFSEAVLAYQEALLLNPDLESARYNKLLIEIYLEQQSEANGTQTGDSDEVDSSNEYQNQGDTEMGVGVAEGSTNPGDDPELGPGLGASIRAGGQVDPFERFDGQEEALQPFDLPAQTGEQPLDPEFLVRWIRSLPETSTELFRRKFLRDAQRQKRQAR